MKNKLPLKSAILIILIFNITNIHAQTRADIFKNNNPSNPLQVKSHLDVFFQTYNFQENGRLSATRFIYNQHIKTRHLITADLPLLLTDYTGQETNIGLGDLKLKYMFIANTNEGEGAYKTLALLLDIHTPTGNTEKGLGTGTFIFAPGISTKLMFTNRLNLYPKISYAFSMTDATYIAAPIGSGILPDPNTDEDEKAKSSNLIIEVPVVVEFINSAGWLKVSPSYAYNFVTNKSSTDFVGELGWMLNMNWGVSFESYVHAWGEQSIKSIFSLNMYFYFK